METERLFLAITLPESVRSRLGESVRLVSQRTERVRWVPRENIHITLKFFGEMSAERKASIVTTMEGVAAKLRPFTLSVTGIEIVRRRRKPQMVWATVADAGEQLQRLHGGAERQLEHSGFERQARSLSPHITLARVRDGIAPWEQQMLEDWATTLRDFTAIALAVESIALMKSDLKPHRAEYSVCKQFELRGT